jgi:hypothetical protein
LVVYLEKNQLVGSRPATPFPLVPAFYQDLDCLTQQLGIDLAHDLFLELVYGFATPLFFRSRYVVE